MIHIETEKSSLAIALAQAEPVRPARLLTRLPRTLISLCFLTGSLLASAATNTTATLVITANGSPVSTIPSGSETTLTAAVAAGGTPVTRGLVTFCDATVDSCTHSGDVGSAQLTSAGTAILRFFPGIGSHSYKAVFAGNSSSNASVSGEQTLTVTGITQTFISSTGSVGNYALSGTVVANATTVSPGGTISFVDSGNHFQVGATTLSKYAATFSLANGASPSLGTESPYFTVEGDFNQDGKMDLAVADFPSYPNGPTPANGLLIFLGNGDGTFTAGPASPILHAAVNYAAAGDFNSDGKLDLAVTVSGSNTVTILLGNGDGSFSVAASSPTIAGAYYLATGDFNGDGNADLVVTNAGDSLSILLGKGDGTFSAAEASPSIGPYIFQVAAGDFNGDGKADLLVGNDSSTNNDPSTIAVLLGNGDGTFTLGTSLSASAQFRGDAGNLFAVGDFNGDGRTDFAVPSQTNAGASSQMIVNVFLSKGDGTFTSEPYFVVNTGGTNACSIGAGDFNGDGKTDLVVTDDEAFAVFLSKGDGTFAAGPSVTGATSSPDDDYLVVGDFNGDGIPDVGVADSDLTTFTVLLAQWTESATASLAGVSVPGTGGQDIQAAFAGNGVFAASTSSAIQLSGSLVSVTLGLTSSASSSTFGQQLLLTATLNPYSDQALTTNGENITFASGGKSLGTGTLSSGVATLNITSLPVGTNNVTASYAGDNSFSSATSPTVPIVVTNPGVNATGLQFIPVTPCRIADTRNAAGPFGGPEMASGATRAFNIPESDCGIPTNAVAYSLNVTVVPSGPLGYLTIWPSGQPQPAVSTLNSDGRVKANAAITPAGLNGGVSVFVSNPTELILDIDGYFVPAGTASALAFYPLTPCRVADTRNTDGPLGGPSLAGGSSRNFPVQMSNCGLPASAQAYSVNVTAVPKGPLGYLTLWPTGEKQPLASTLNAASGTVTANAAIVPAGTGGDISVYASNTSDVVLDVNGYFAAPSASGLSLYTTTPCRVLDTRSSSGAFSGVLSVSVASSACAPPSTAQAYVLNATVLPPSPLGYLTLWPAGSNEPNASTLNASDKAITSNMAIVPTNNGKIDAFASSSTQLILDISSYFAADTGTQPDTRETRIGTARKTVNR